ncbi:MAG: helix-turn-helix domain-containing protein [Staphylococcus sp.]|nr:helix-turn-helix domain-containing protein [Staphylococcus sp.]
MFGIIVSGRLCIEVDFNIQNLCEGELRVITPGQVHRFAGGESFEGWMLMVEREIVDDRYKLIFEEASINGVFAQVGDKDFENIRMIFSLIYSILSKESVDIHVVRSLVSAFVGIVAGHFKNVCSQKAGYNSRYSEILIQLNSLLQTNLANSHSPSFYADKLHISASYLNEVVKSVTGSNVSNYIRNEIVLRAKRMLYHTNMTVKEIAAALGFDDSAYLTRIFTKTTGKSPAKFRV